LTIHLLTGPIRSGKTTRLAAWAAATPGAAGLLMPDTARGRQFWDVSTGFAWPTAARLGELHPLTIGRFQFSAAAFAWAGAALRGAATNPATQWLMADEIGPLELRGEGLAAALRDVLALPQPPPNLVLVVRETLVEQVVAAFNLRQWPIRAFYP
jgi:nucleoside-triphosphatase THEP1